MPWLAFVTMLCRKVHAVENHPKSKNWDVSARFGTITPILLQLLMFAPPKLHTPLGRSREYFDTILNDIFNQTVSVLLRSGVTKIGGGVYAFS